MNQSAKIQEEPATVPPAPVYRKYGINGWEEIEGRVIIEAPVGLTVNGEMWLTFMCTPDQLDALAAGFLYNEGILQSPEEIEILRPCENNSNVDVWLNHPVKRPNKWQRTSGCTGGFTSVIIPKGLKPLPVTLRITPADLAAGMDQLFHVEGLYQEFRGMHCSGLSDGVEIRCHAADIGRHNTFDKLAGLHLLQSRPMPHKMVLTTGRISSEMLQKSARFGAEVVVSRTSPTSMSIALADRLGVTLIGYARRETFIVYSHAERIETT
ncbi:MAG: formate dehydrogenase accessory sulfurtransferase FdhD [Anaerolineaceae bacterium]|nr:formate dehydrogenase accessory sulfurtransferase FdhD [Anaerolineaceae bacterium]